MFDDEKQHQKSIWWSTNIHTRSYQNKTMYFFEKKYNAANFWKQ